MGRYAEDVTFRSSMGEALVGRLHRPPGRPVAWAVFAHCFACGGDVEAARKIAECLGHRGIGVLRLDFTGIGEGGGSEAGFYHSVADLVAAADWLRVHEEGPRLLVGHSLAGAAAIAAARRIPELRAVATIGAPSDPLRGVRWLETGEAELERTGRATITLGERSFEVGRDLLEELSADALEQHLRKLGRALLLMHSPQDAVVDIAHAATLYEAAWHPKSFVSLDGADHLLCEPADCAYVGTVIAAWAGRYLDVRRGQDVREAAGQQGEVLTTIGRDRFATEIVASGHRLNADEPVGVGGTDTGPSPYDLLLGALGACTAMTLRMYADRKKWPLDAVDVTLKHQRLHGEDCEACDEKRKFVDHVDRVVTVRGDLSAAQRRRLLEIADRCPVHRTLEAGMEIETHELRR